MPAYPVLMLETPWSADELADLAYEQTADVMVFAHPSHAPQRLRRYSHTAWIIDAMPVTNGVGPPTDLSVTEAADTGKEGYVATDYAYAVTAIDGETGQESAPSAVETASNDLSIKGNTNSLSWTAVTGASEYRVYGHRNGSYGYMGTSVDPAFLDDNIAPDYSRGVPVAGNPFASGENPAAVTFHDGRLVHGRTPGKPNGLFLSRPDSIYNFDYSRPQAPDDSIDVQLRGRGLNAVQHLVSMGSLIAFTNNAIFELASDSGGLALETLYAKPAGQIGAGRMRPEVVVDVCFYSTVKGDAIRSLGYQYEADGFRGADLTVFSPHLFSGRRMVEAAWCASPSRVLWVCRDDGALLALTWQAEQDVWGWTPCETDGVFESVCAVPERGYDCLYVVVRREVNGAEVRYIERLAYPHWIEEGWSDLSRAVVLDCSATYEGDAETEFSGLDYLEGLTISALADGFVKTGLIVTDGRVSIDDPTGFERVTFGIPYESVWITLGEVFDGREGTSKGQRTMAANVIVEVMNTAGLEGGEAPDNLHVLPPPDGTPQTWPPSLWNGLIDPMGVSVGDWRSESITLRQSKPLPAVILSITTEFKVGG